MTTSNKTFRIIEYSTEYFKEIYDEYYDDFKKDYLNPYIRIPELKEKYDILSKSLFRDFCNKVKFEEGISQKPHRKLLVRDTQNIKKNGNGFFTIYRKSNKNPTRYYGVYDSLDGAKIVRDKLYECDFDETIAKSLIDEYGYKGATSKKGEALEKYDEWLDLYKDKSISYIQIRKMMKFSSYQYQTCYDKMCRESPQYRRQK